MDEQNTIIVEGRSDKEGIDKRIKLPETEIDVEESDFCKKELRKRLAKLSGGVAVIKVGDVPETELKKKMMMTDDALNATKAAV